MLNMGIGDRFRLAFDYLLKKGMIHKKSQLAEMMGYSRSVVSNAYNGKDEFLTAGFLQKFCNAFPGVFNYEWLMEGEGTMLAASQMAQEAVKEAQPTSAPLANEEWYRSQIKELTTMLNNAYTLIARLQQENEMLRGFSIYGTQVAESDAKPYSNIGKEK